MEFCWKARTPEKFSAPAHVPANQRAATVPTRATGVIGAGRNLAVVAGLPANYELTRALANPDLYDPRTLEAMWEDYLILYRLTEWPCERCGHTNVTPDAEFSCATSCAACGAP